MHVHSIYIYYSVSLTLHGEQDFTESGPHAMKIAGLVRDLNSGPLAPEARIIPLDQRANGTSCFDIGSSKFIEPRSLKCRGKGSWRARPGFEPRTSRTLSENHTPRPTSHHEKGLNSTQVTNIFGMIGLTGHFSEGIKNPSSRIWTSDLWISDIYTTVHRSTNWAIEGIPSVMVAKRQDDEKCSQ